MSSAAGGGGGYGGGGGEHQHQQHHHHLLLGQAAGQLYHVPQHSRRRSCGSRPTTRRSRRRRRRPGRGRCPGVLLLRVVLVIVLAAQPDAGARAVGGAWDAAGAATSGGAQIPSQNFALSLSSASSNPPPTPRRQFGGGGGGAAGPYGPFTGYAAVLGRSRFLGPAQKLLEEICDVGGRPAQLDRGSDEGLLDVDAMEAAGSVDHEMDGSDRAVADAVTVSGAEQQWRKTRLISLMEDVSNRKLYLLFHIAASVFPKKILY